MLRPGGIETRRSHVAVQSELEGILKHSSNASGAFALGSDRNLIAMGDWSELLLFNGSDGWDTRHCGHAPTTCKLLSTRAEVVGRPAGAPDAHSEWQVTFLRLAPRSRLAWHTGTSNERLTAHLGLLIPRECVPPRPAVDGGHLDGGARPCELSVGSPSAVERLQWQEGRALVFDDSFFHSAANLATSSARYVLYVSFWHPELGPFVEPVPWPPIRSNPLVPP